MRTEFQESVQQNKPFEFDERWCNLTYHGDYPIFVVGIKKTHFLEKSLIDMNYEWDENKAASNLRKHGILFSDAVAVFEDDMALSREDIDAFEEQRFVVTGMDFMGRVLTIAYTYRYGTIRLISAASN